MNEWYCIVCIYTDELVHDYDYKMRNVVTYIHNINAIKILQNA